MATASLDRIDEALVEAYVVERRKRVSPATVNRQLATLRRALRLAQEWRVIDRVPRIRLLPGEREREFVLRHDQEALYLGVAPQPLHDVALLILDTGLRVGEAVNLAWREPASLGLVTSGFVHLEPANGAKYGYVQVGKSKNARRNLSLAARVRVMLEGRCKGGDSAWVFPGLGPRQPFGADSLSHQHVKARKLLRLPQDFVIHSLRHTMLTRLGEAGADAFTIMRIAGHSSVTVSQRYVHPSPEALERAFERLDAMNAQAAERLTEGQRPLLLPAISPTLGGEVSVTH